ncbi:hypothetical protein NLJ89_g326 [Agrocybe chaxingu]|uniref:non-specific serine/threonine protein kinase n=1 Tax=Agrocybe chaxingu TaxID=84603 RepID=A0A9W8TF82_9AGAR|nr:hypothetical protein NLJ89_g326 [Agrocybe chaxingu]
MFWLSFFSDRREAPSSRPQADKCNKHRGSSSHFEEFALLLTNTSRSRSKNQEAVVSTASNPRHFNGNFVPNTDDPDAFTALQVIYEALHDPSILDARRHQRYGLQPVIHIVFPDTPLRTPLSGPLHTPGPRCVLDLIDGEAHPTVAHLAFPLWPLAAPAKVGLAISALRASKASLLLPSTLCSHPTPLPPARTTIMNVGDFSIIRFLGEGTSGKVYYVKDRISRAKAALKVIPKEDKNEYALGVVLQEREISEKLSDSPWFVGLWASWHDRANLYIAMTLYPTDLDSEMIKCKIIEPERARFYMAEIIIALTELHSRGIVHRDIKAPNILIDRDGHIVLGDFGLVKDFNRIPTLPERVYQPYWPYLPTDDPTKGATPRPPDQLHFVAWDYRGSELEMAPEIHMREPYSFGVDYWSAAVVLYWMLTGRPPFYEDEAEYEDGGEQDVKPLSFKIIEDDLYWDPGDKVDEDAKDFLERMLEKDPRDRLMISYEIPNHPYFASIDWPLMEARLVTPPWVPTGDIGHVYEPTASSSFTPGEPYVSEADDPCPEFTFLSQQAKIWPQLDEDEYDSDYDSDDDTVTDEMGPGSKQAKIIPAWPHFAQARLELSNTPNGSQDIRTLKSDSLDSNVSLKDSWQRSFVNPPSNQPCGDGRKRWLYAQDLLQLHTPYIASHRSAMNSSPALATKPRQVTSQRPLSEINTRPRACTSRFEIDPSLLNSPTDASRPQHVNHVVNGTGVLFKVKVWISKLKTPKPKKGFPLSRLSFPS